MSIPLDAGAIHFLAEGALSRGTFELSTTAPVGSKEAIVEVDVAYHYPEAFADMTTCRMHSEETGSWGLGIFVRLFRARTVSRGPLTRRCRRLACGFPVGDVRSNTMSISASPPSSLEQSRCDWDS